MLIPIAHASPDGSRSAETRAHARANAVSKVLLVQAQADLQSSCEEAARRAGMEVLAEASAERAKRLLGPQFLGVVVTNMCLPRLVDGLQFLRFVSRVDAGLPVIMMTGRGETAQALEAMRSGAYDCIEEPISPELFVETVKRALEKRRLTLEVDRLRRRLAQGCHIEARIIGSSPQIEAVRRSVLDLADAAAHALIIGDLGTEKELVARCVHDFSRREAENFVILNCGDFTEDMLDRELFGYGATNMRKPQPGKLELAGAGTLFLNEVDKLPASLQLKLLQVLRHKEIEPPASKVAIPVAPRIIAASQTDLHEHVAKGHFEADLYTHLSTAIIELPRLRERRGDIPALYEQFLLVASKRFGKPPPADALHDVRQLLTYDWPENIRELRNHADCRLLGIPHGANPVRGTGQARPTLTETVETFERALIAAELERHSGNVARSSEALGVARTTLHDKLRKYGMN